MNTGLVGDFVGEEQTRAFWARLRAWAARGRLGVRRALTRPAQTLFRLWEGFAPGARDRERQALYRRVFDTPDGRKVLADIMMTSGYLAQPTPAAPHETAFREGARWTVAQILASAGVGERALSHATLNDDASELFDDRDQYPDDALFD